MIQIIRSIDEYTPLQPPIVLTIGNFDGMHRGHQQVLQQVKNYADQHHAHSALITFENHPSTILRPDQPVELICSLEHRLKLFEEMGIKTVFLLTFNQDFANQTAEDFLIRLRQKLPFSHFVLGHDATLGRDRQGDPKVMQKLSERLGFTLEYLDSFLFGDLPISSSQIRRAIRTGDFKTASDLLGREYGIRGIVQKGMQVGGKLGFPTANLDVRGMCLPPRGVYAVKIQYENHEFHGVANLGTAPTVRDTKDPLLEVHLLDFEGDLSNECIEVIFVEFLRGEEKFENVEKLRSQIQIDISKAKQILKL